MIKLQTLPHAVAVALLGFATTAVAHDAAYLARAITAARVALDADRPDVACGLLYETHGESTQSTDALYVLAHCSAALGLIDDAIATYERLVVLMPDAPRPRIELATLYAQRGDKARAQSLYREAAARQQGTPVAEMLESLADSLTTDNPAELRAPPRRWSLSLSADAAYDTNINAGPTSETTAAVIGGVPVTLRLNPALQPKEDWSTRYAIGGRYLQPLAKQFAILYQGSVNIADYFDNSLYNTDSAALGVAFLYRDGPFSLSVQPNARYVYQRDELQEATHGLTVRATRYLSRTLQLNGSVGYFDRRIPLTRYRDADGYSASIGVAHVPASWVRVGADYLFQREDAQIDSESRDLNGVSVYALMSAGPSLRLLASYRYMDLAYDARQPLFAYERADDQQQARVRAIWSLERWLDQDMDVSLEYSYTDNASNLALNDYDRELVSFGLRMRF